MARFSREIRLYMKKNWDDKWVLDVTDFIQDESESLILMELRTVSLDLPDSWDPVPIQLAALRAKLEKMRAVASAAETEVIGKINSLLAIEMNHG